MVVAEPLNTLHAVGSYAAHPWQNGGTRGGKVREGVHISLVAAGEGESDCPVAGGLLPHGQPQTKQPVAAQQAATLQGGRSRR